jgi:Tfp pilus assembly protein PilF
MLFDASKDIKAALSYARNFSLENELYYIDSQMILLGLLDSFAFDNLMQPEDIGKMINWLTMLDWERRTIFNIHATLPITLEAERMLKHAAWFQNHLKDEHLRPEHVMLSLLSIENLCQHKLASLGIIFRTFAASIDTDRDIPYRSPKIKASRWLPRNFIQLYFMNEVKKRAIVRKHLTEARDFLQYRDRKRSRRACRFILQIDPKHTNALWISGIAWSADRRFDKAIPYYEKVLAMHPEHTGVMAQLAHCYSQSGESSRAIELYLKALALNPHSADLLNSLGFVLTDLQQYDRAITLFDQAIGLDDTCAYAYNNKGYVLMRLGYLSQARALMLQSLELNRGNPYTYRNLGLLALQERNREQAREMLEMARLYEFKEKYGNEVDNLLRTL